VHACSCGPGLVDRYYARISGPLLDRIDIHLRVPAVPYAELGRDAPGEPSAAIRGRVEAARERQRERFCGKAGCTLTPTWAHGKCGSIAPRRRRWRGFSAPRWNGSVSRRGGVTGCSSCLERSRISPAVRRSSRRMCGRRFSTGRSIGDRRRSAGDQQKINLGTYDPRSFGSPQPHPGKGASPHRLSSCEIKPPLGPNSEGPVVSQ